MISAATVITVKSLGTIDDMSLNQLFNSSLFDNNSVGG
jgi:hypothetical protein